MTKGLLLAVCLAAVGMWAFGGKWSFAASRVAPSGSGGVDGNSLVEVAAGMGGAWLEVGEERIDPTIPPERDGGLRQWLAGRRGWRAGWETIVPPWARQRWPWTGWGRLGAGRVEMPALGGRYDGWSAGAPLWGIVVASGAWPLTSLALVVRRWRRRRRPARSGLCPACGYDWRATPGRCPECGEGNA
jgi:hypothetical protein